MREGDFLKVIRDDPEDKSHYLVYADWLEEHGRLEDSKSIRKYAGDFSVLQGVAAPAEVKSYNWNEVFAYAGLEQGAEGSVPPSPALPNDDIDLSPFARMDVKRIIAVCEGEHDEADWLVAGELNDGRFFFIAAGCDYTGWG